MSQINQLFFREVVDFLTENVEITQLTKNQLDLIAKTYYSYIINLDNILDGDIVFNEDILKDNPLINLTDHHEKCIYELIDLFGKDSDIFKSKKKYSDLYFNELIKEKLLISESYITREQYENLAINKHIPVFFIVDGISILTKKSYPKEDIKTMLSHIFKGIQMYDDITDIGDDLLNNQATYIISKTIQYLKNDNDYYPDNKSYTHKAFFALSEISNPEFDYMIAEFDNAKRIAEKYQLNKIVSWANAINEQILDWKSQIEEIRNA